MEQKKILWIATGVGIFLLTIMGWALFTYAPQDISDPVMTFAQAQNDVWVNPTTIQLLNDPRASAQNEVGSQIPATTPGDLLANTMQANDLTVFSSGNTTIFSADGVTTIDLTAEDETNANVAKTSETATSPVTEKVVTPVTTRVPSTTPTTPKVASTPAPKTTPQRASTPVAVPKAPIDQYWVQAASFTSKTNAESARKALTNEKMPTEVFTYDDKAGLTYYRLRVGPYTTKSEAEYWNSFIKLIDQFTGTQSYVTNSTKPQA